MKEEKRKASKVAAKEAVIDWQIPSNISLIVSVKIAGYLLGQLCYRPYYPLSWATVQGAWNMGNLLLQPQAMPRLHC